jgi:hypothetical protein
MLVPWELRRGPEYARSVEEARLEAGGQFDANLRELLARIRINPAEATPLLDPNHRVLQIFDIPNDYSLALYVALEQQKRICQLEWLATVPIDPEFDPWDPR